MPSIHSKEDPYGNQQMMKLTFPIDERVIAACPTPEKLTIEYWESNYLLSTLAGDEPHQRTKYALIKVRSLIFHTIDILLERKGILYANDPADYYARQHGLVTPAESAEWEKYSGRKAIPY